MDPIIEAVLKKHKIVRYHRTFEEVLLSYKEVLKEGVSAIVDGTDKEIAILKAQLAAADANLQLAVEFGYKHCEKGNNLDATLIEFNKSPVIGNNG